MSHGSGCFSFGRKAVPHSWGCGRKRPDAISLQPFPGRCKDIVCGRAQAVDRSRSCDEIWQLAWCLLTHILVCQERDLVQHTVLHWQPVQLAEHGCDMLMPTVQVPVSTCTGCQVLHTQASAVMSLAGRTGEHCSSLAMMLWKHGPTSQLCLEW